jgi:hypothetical protein
MSESASSERAAERHEPTGRLRTAWYALQFGMLVYDGLVFIVSGLKLAFGRSV